MSLQVRRRAENKPLNRAVAASADKRFTASGVKQRNVGNRASVLTGDDRRVLFSSRIEVQMRQSFGKPSESCSGRDSQRSVEHISRVGQVDGSAARRRDLIQRVLDRRRVDCSGRAEDRVFVRRRMNIQAFDIAARDKIHGGNPRVAVKRQLKPGRGCRID